MLKKRKDLVFEEVTEHAMQLNNTIEYYKRGHGTKKSKLTIRCQKCQTLFDTSPLIYVAQKEPCVTCVSNFDQREGLKENLLDLQNENPDKMSIDIEETFVIPNKFLQNLEKTVVKKEDLKEIKYDLNGSLKPNWFREMNRDNLYFQHIENCRKKGYAPTEKTQEHHIIPRHFINGYKNVSISDKHFCESAENKIRLSVSDHILAHTLLYAIYGQFFDLCAVKMLNKQFTEVGQLIALMGAAASHKKQKELGIGFYDPIFLNKLQRAKHWEKTVKCSDVYDWFFKGQYVVTITGQGMVCDIIQILNTYHPTKISRLSRLIKGEIQSSYEWTCKKIN